MEDGQMGRQINTGTQNGPTNVFVLYLFYVERGCAIDYFLLLSADDRKVNDM